ncbi:MAG: hypothetical protein A2Z11_03400 [Candidatus Woykebacteria bacterium RBG_16_43_9]|uniref:Nudix hydrolase domain-containing protein n=2 Tax=Candidatus Woykeibacteriota TaxID=1817899 RepID=A0A1G1WHM0_9BACT|nr:MAG: hypothetical protein A2Z11_03400 [Candidatus Woykebacteria bacterium RBG_16_43_9]OGY27850.1 MAG: hypothetical protein A2Z42_00985 [Candidatus Woykebacteria bacterium RBG_19FT_COMBO_43_10]
MFSDKDLDKAIVIAVAIIEKEGKLLMVQEADANFRGKWNVPAGHINPGENPLAAVVREAKEETGLDVEPKSLAGIQVYRHDTGRSSVRFNFNCEVKGGEIGGLEEEIMDVKWMSVVEIEDLKEQGKLRGDKTWWSVQDWLGKKEYPLELIEGKEGDYY